MHKPLQPHSWRKLRINTNRQIDKCACDSHTNFQTNSLKRQFLHTAQFFERHQTRLTREEDWKCKTGWNYSIGKNCAKGSVWNLPLRQSRAKDGEFQREKHRAYEIKSEKKEEIWGNMISRRKEMWDWPWYIVDISILFLQWKAVFPQCIKYF